MARECCNQSNKGRLPEKRITFILLSGGALAGAGFTLGNVLGTLINYLLDSWVTGSIGYLSGFTLSYAACYLIGILVGQKILSWRENEEEKSPSSEE